MKHSEILQDMKDNLCTPGKESEALTLAIKLLENAQFDIDSMIERGLTEKQANVAYLDVLALDCESCSASYDYEVEHACKV